MTDIFHTIGELAMHYSVLITLTVFVAGVVFLVAVGKGVISNFVFGLFMSVLILGGSSSAYAVTREIPTNKIDMFHSKGVISECVMDRLKMTNDGYSYYRKPVKYVTIAQIENRFC